MSSRLASPNISQPQLLNTAMPLEAMKMHTENLRRLRQVMGAAHPETRRTEHNVKVLQECIDDAIARAHTVK